MESSTDGHRYKRRGEKAKRSRENLLPLFLLFPSVRICARELYDHENDPKEITNLAEKSAHAETVIELSKQLRAAVKSTFPASGKTPELTEDLWPPTLVQ